jgi:hypothetical protein
MMINWKGFGRKRSWYNRHTIAAIEWRNRRKPWDISVRIDSALAKLELVASRIQVQSFVSRPDFTADDIIIIIIIIIIIKRKAIPVTGCGGPYGFETSRLPHF